MRCNTLKVAFSCAHLINCLNKISPDFSLFMYSNTSCFSEAVSLLNTLLDLMLCGKPKLYKQNTNVVTLFNIVENI